MGQRLTQWITQPVAILLLSAGVASGGVVSDVRPVWGQISRLDQLLSDAPTLTSGFVYVDGRPVFTIATRPVTSPDGEAPSALEQRRRVIEDELQRIADQGLAPDTVEITWQVDSASSLPIININGRYVLTVTTLDAQLQGTDPETWAAQLTERLSQTLAMAYQERQNAFVVRQVGISVGIVVAGLLLHWGLERMRRHLKHLHENPPSHPDDPQSVLRYQRRQISLELQQRLLRVADVALGVGGGTLLLGLFPYSRWLQVLVIGLLRGPALQLLGVTVGTYLLLRLSALGIDQFFSVLTQEGWVPGHTTRLMNRMRTFSNVSKGISATVLSTSGVIVGASIIGINVGPLLAGAGIIGLAISFAAQNLIRDVINGLLILLEDQYAEGDVIVLEQVGGLVESMNLRITQLRNNEGMLITIPNGAISIVRNLSNGWSRVDLGIQVSYQADPDLALKVVQETADGMRQEPQWQRRILNVEVLGIDDLNERGMLIRLWVKVLPLEQWAVAREYRRRIKYALDRAGIPIPTSQDVWFRTPLNLAAPQDENWIHLLHQVSKPALETGDISGS
ncbi:MAG: mechanosensitive ion channel family protein [Synechococcales cyanobacterium]